jgi:hypothetical protein
MVGAKGSNRTIGRFGFRDAPHLKERKKQRKKKERTSERKEERILPLGTATAAA